MNPVKETNGTSENKPQIQSLGNNNVTRPPKTEINPDNINATINEMIRDSNVLSAFELNETNLQFLKELRKMMY